MLVENGLPGKAQLVTPPAVVLAQRKRKGTEGVETSAIADRRWLRTQTSHFGVHPLEFIHGGTARIASAPGGTRREPHRKRFREIFVRVALGISEAQVSNEPSAV